MKNDIQFCSECGEELDSFGIEGGDIDIDKIQARHKLCKEKGKFKGDVCAMLFIADPEEPAESKDVDG